MPRIKYTRSRSEERDGSELYKSPAFQFYPKDFMTDRKVLVMSPEVRGLYIWLLCIDWLEDGFPKDALLILSGYLWHDQHGNLRDDDGHSIAIAQLSDCFIEHPTKDGFLTNPRLQKERAAQIHRRADRAKSGEKGAKTRWGKELEPIATPSTCHQLANGKPIANDSSSSSSSSSSAIDPDTLRVSEHTLALKHFGKLFRTTQEHFDRLVADFTQGLISQELPEMDEWLEHAKTPNARKYRKPGHDHYLFARNWLKDKRLKSSPRPSRQMSNAEHNTIVAQEFLAEIGERE